jgi:hypothetical protein
MADLNLVAGTNITLVQSDDNLTINSTTDTSGLESTSNKVTTISSSSTDTQYPSAKCVYDIVGNVETLLETLDIGEGVE